MNVKQDLRDRLITGSFAIGQGYKEPTNWKTYAEDLELEYEKLAVENQSLLITSRNTASLPSLPTQEELNEETVKQIAWIAWKGAANAFRMYPDHKHTFTEYWDAAKNQFEKYFASLPSVLVHPSFKVKEGDWIEQWREGWEGLALNGEWILITELQYKIKQGEVRKVILPLVEKSNLPTSEKLKECGMNMNEYLLRKNLDNALLERDELKNQVMALSAIKRGLEKSLDEAFTKIPPPSANTPGSEQDLYVKCGRCNGDGYTSEHNDMSRDYETGEHNCSQCPIQVQCEKCQATGYIPHTSLQQPVPELKWVSVGKQYPTPVDGDKSGNVLGWDKFQKETHKCNVEDIHQMKMRFTHWMPLPSEPAPTHEVK